MSGPRVRPQVLPPRVRGLLLRFYLTKKVSPLGPVKRSRGSDCRTLQETRVSRPPPPLVEGPCLRTRGAGPPLPRPTTQSGSGTPTVPITKSYTGFLMSKVPGWRLSLRQLRDLRTGPLDVGSLTSSGPRMDRLPGTPKSRVTVRVHVLGYGSTVYVFHGSR